MESISRHECSDCQFVQDKETLFIFLVPRELKDKATNKPLFFGKFTMRRWTGHSGFYLFRCKSCNQVSIDYPHGYVDFGLMYLDCDNCDEKLILEVKEERAIYEREGVFIPKPNSKERDKELNDAIVDIEKMGIRVIDPNFDSRISDKSSAQNVWSVGLWLLAILTGGILLFRILN